MAAKTGDSDGGSMTPSEPSDGDDRSDRDSDYESDDEEEWVQSLDWASQHLSISISQYLGINITFSLENCRFD